MIIPNKPELVAGYRNQDATATWRNGRAGTILAEFPVQLPAGRPMRLRFANAIRDHYPQRNEPPSDGVTFRVRVVPFETPVENKRGACPEGFAKAS